MMEDETKKKNLKKWKDKICSWRGKLNTNGKCQLLPNKFIFFYIMLSIACGKHCVKIVLFLKVKSMEMYPN